MQSFQLTFVVDPQKTTGHAVAAEAADLVSSDQTVHALVTAVSATAVGDGTAGISVGFDVDNWTEAQIITQHVTAALSARYALDSVDLRVTVPA